MAKMLISTVIMKNTLFQCGCPIESVVSITVTHIQNTLIQHFFSLFFFFLFQFQLNNNRKTKPESYTSHHYTNEQEKKTILSWK